MAAASKKNGREKRVVNKPNTNQVEATKKITSTAGTKRQRNAKAQATKRIKAKARESDSDDGDDYDENDTHNNESEDENQREEKEGEEKKKQQRGKKKKNDNEKDEEVRTASDMNPGKINIPRPKGAPFADAISPDTLQFMSELAENNHRDFMRLNEKRWHTARKDFIDFIKTLIDELHNLDPTVLIEEARYAIYRQNRDLRFTNDLRPYKTFLSAAFSRGGKKSAFALYYISIEPGNKTLVAAGLWQPNSDKLARMRQGIIANADLMREALSIPRIKEVFGEDGLAILESSDKLKVAPKNIPKDHPEIEMLRYKSMAASKTFTDEEVVSEGFLDKVLDVYEALVPFVTVLNSWTG